MAVSGATAPALWLRPAGDNVYYVLHAQNRGVEAIPPTVEAALKAMIGARRNKQTVWILARHAVELRKAGYMIQPPTGVDP